MTVYHTKNVSNAKLQLEYTTTQINVCTYKIVHTKKYTLNKVSDTHVLIATGAHILGCTLFWKHVFTNLHINMYSHIYCHLKQRDTRKKIRLIWLATSQDNMAKSQLRYNKYDQALNDYLDQ